MAFAAAIATSPDNPTALTTNAVTYDLTSYVPSGSYRRVAGLDLNEPQVLRISHETVAKTGVKRHLVRFDDTHEDAVDPTVVGTISVQLVISVPPVVASQALIDAAVRKLVNFLATSGVSAKIVNEEI